MRAPYNRNCFRRETGFEDRFIVRMITSFVAWIVVISGAAVLLPYDQTASGQETPSSSSSPTASAQPPEATAQDVAGHHGLLGNYFVLNLKASTAKEAQKMHPPYYTQVFFDKDDYGLPKAVRPPAVTRVDPQIAFGSHQDEPDYYGTEKSVWWPTDYAVPAGWQTSGKPWEHVPAVIWNGYIHLPKAGTYYFATISRGASAVYLNKARVALNGGYGGSIPTEELTYEGAPSKSLSHPNPEQDAYIVPVTVETPRDIPIEVRASLQNKHSPHGIDLYWVTPDSSRAADGKLLATIVPSEVLYVDPPGPIENAAVRTANSTISTDYLYFPTDYVDQFVTLTVRLADENGKPVPGKRVHVTGLVSYGTLDTIIQPEQPTDNNGVTTAKVRAGGDLKVPHDSTFIATDTTDTVAVAQVAHVTFQNVPNSFFPATYAPYYDGQKFLVEPLPLVVGQPVTIKIPLTNRGNFPAELTVQFFHNNWNIGAPGWYEIGKPQQLRLKPGESKEMSANWTPQAAQTHQCFKIEVSGNYLASAKMPARFLATVPLPFFSIASIAPGERGGLGARIKGALSRNIGPVTCSPQYMAVYTLTGHGIADFCLGGGGGSDGGPPSAAPGRHRRRSLPRLHVPRGSRGKEPVPPRRTPSNAPDSDSSPNPEPTAQPDSHPMKGGQKAGARQFADQALERCADIRAHLDVAQKNGRPKDGAVANLASSIEMAKLKADYNDCVAEASAWTGVANDPPDADYRNLAIAASDTAVGYIDAARVSLERYQAAEDNADRQWMGRHLTAMGLYFKKVAAAEQAMAEKEEQEVAQLQENNHEVADAQAALNALVSRLQDNEPTRDDLKSAQQAGLSAEEAAGFYDDLVELAKPKEVKTLRATILGLATLRREIGEQLEQLAALLPAATTQARTYAQNFIVGNPHDKTETVNLLIRRVSIPADWQLSIASVPEPETDTPTAKKSQPTKPVLKEIEPGSLYSVELPAKATMQVASILFPKEVAANTTAQWAVEGRIGNELIGGMVHELNVPSVISDLQLPPVGSGVQRRSHFTTLAVIGAALFLLVSILVFWRSRRKSLPDT